MPPLIVLDQVGAFYGDRPETAGWRTCAYCCEDSYEDCAGQERAWYALLGGHGMMVCEHCLPYLLAEDW